MLPQVGITTTLNGVVSKTGLRRPDHRSQSCSYWRRYLQHGSYRAGCYFRVEQRSPKGYRFLLSIWMKQRLPISITTEYLHWLRKPMFLILVCGEKHFLIPWYGGKNLPSTNHSWRHTSRHPSYDSYPVVGVNWEQATKYASWEVTGSTKWSLLKEVFSILHRIRKILKKLSYQIIPGWSVSGQCKENLKDNVSGGERPVTLKTVFYCLITFCLQKPSGNMPLWLWKATKPTSQDEVITDRRIYPWNGNTSRYKNTPRTQGDIQANFKRGRGDYMGMAGAPQWQRLCARSCKIIYAKRLRFCTTWLVTWANGYKMFTDPWLQLLWVILKTTTSTHSGVTYSRNSSSTKKVSLLQKDSLGKLKYQMVEDSMVSQRETTQRKCQKFPRWRCRIYKVWLRCNYTHQR